MLKYAKLDIENGIQYLKVGFHNIIAAILTGELPEFVVNISLNYPFIVGIVKLTFPDADLAYAENMLELNFKEKVVKIIIDDTKITFK